LYFAVFRMKAVVTAESTKMIVKDLAALRRQAGY
jgi:hypothetical protein